MAVETVHHKIVHKRFELTESEKSRSLSGQLKKVIKYDGDKASRQFCIFDFSMLQYRPVSLVKQPQPHDVFVFKTRASFTKKQKRNKSEFQNSHILSFLYTFLVYHDGKKRVKLRDMDLGSGQFSTQSVFNNRLLTLLASSYRSLRSTLQSNLDKNTLCSVCYCTAQFLTYLLNIRGIDFRKRKPVPQL